MTASNRIIICYTETKALTACLKHKMPRVLYNIWSLLLLPISGVLKAIINKTVFTQQELLGKDSVRETMEHLSMMGM